MEWYYVENGERVGPVTEEQLQQLVLGLQITGETLVWNPAMANWQPYGQLARPQVPVGAVGLAPDQESGICTECGRALPTSEMINFGERWVCADCKPLFFQKLKEGASVSNSFVYAGFWIRVAAKLIDGLILFALQMILAMVFRQMATLLGYPIAIAYTTYFLGRFGQTPGKMACGLRVIRADGQPVSYLRAFGRYFAEILSGIIFCIGYVMVAFDEEKRALHDRICDTRVIKING